MIFLSEDRILFSILFVAKYLGDAHEIVLSPIFETFGAMFSLEMVCSMSRFYRMV